MSRFVEFFVVFGMATFLIVKCTENSDSAQASGRANELQRYENEEVICFSRRYSDSNIVCKFK